MVLMLAFGMTGCVGMGSYKRYFPRFIQNCFKWDGWFGRLCVGMLIISGMPRLLEL